jgi:hypothetical protein
MKKTCQQHCFSTLNHNLARFARHQIRLDAIGKKLDEGRSPQF